MCAITRDELMCAQEQLKLSTRDRPSRTHTIADFWTNCPMLISFMKNNGAGAASSSSTKDYNRFCCSPLHPCALHSKGHELVHDDQNRGASFPDELCTLFAITLNSFCSPQRCTAWTTGQGLETPKEAPLRNESSSSSNVG